MGSHNKEVDLGSLHRLENGTSVNKDTRLQREWIVRSHVFFIRVWKFLPSRRALKTLKGSPFVRVWKFLSSRRGLKILKGSPKGKLKEDNTF